MKPIPFEKLDTAARRLMARAEELSTRDLYNIVYTDFLTPRE